MTPEQLNKWAVLPRLFMATTCVLTWKSALWFMTLDNPTAAQSAFVSVIASCASGAFAVWINKELK